MVADNLGMESVGYYDKSKMCETPTLEKYLSGRIHRTPNLNKMAQEGVVFDNCYICTPLCAPARCAWNTGRHAYRVGLNEQLDPNDPESGLSSKEVTIAEILRDAGYYTALFGKWNLGYDRKFNPLNFGFDEFYGSTAGHADYYTHIYDRSGRCHFYSGFKPINDEGYFDKLFTDEAISFLERMQKKGKPFYMNLCFYAPHGPYQTPPGYPWSQDVDVNYRYMVEYLDKCVGRVIDRVDELGFSESTLIVFLSDQGGSRTNGYGRTLWEPSIRVICNARWNGVIPEGTRVYTPWMHYDLYATFAALAGAKVPTDRVIDSQNIWPLFEGKELKHDRTFHWTHRRGREGAIRIGDWKLHMTNGEVDGLFDLSKDPCEKNDLSSEYPELVKKMQTLHDKWIRTCKAQQTSTAHSGKKYPDPNHKNGY